MLYLLMLISSVFEVTTVRCKIRSLEMSLTTLFLQSTSRWNWTRKAAPNLELTISAMTVLILGRVCQVVFLYDLFLSLAVIIVVMMGSPPAYFLSKILIAKPAWKSIGTVAELIQAATSKSGGPWRVTATRLFSFGAPFAGGEGLELAWSKQFLLFFHLR